MTRIVYLDCFAGISGDMLLGALVDVGWPVARLQAVADALLPNIAIRAEQVSRQQLSATHITIDAPDAQPLRHPADLTELIAEADLPAEVQQRAIAVITLLADAEARIHGIPVDKIHFHEVGAVDTLVDVVGSVMGLADLGVERVIVSPVPWSRGTIKMAHGRYPVPPPAVAALLTGVPVVGIDLEGETVTPTGAALLKGLADDFGVMPTMTLSQVGYGAGTRHWPDRPNVLRLALGEVGESGITAETLTVLACNLDDMIPEWYGPLIETMLEAGALDIWLTPIQMKKGRPAVMAEVLCRPSDARKLRKMLFEQTTTLGIREYQVKRWALPREVRHVATPYGDVRIKVATLANGTTKFSPEHDDCVMRAAEHGVSARAVWIAAAQAANEVR